MDDVVVVLGYEAQAILKSVERSGLSPRFVVNEQFESGQLSSVLAWAARDRPSRRHRDAHDAGRRAASSPPQPSAPCFDRYRTTRAPVVRPVCGALHGHPVLVDRSLFDIDFAPPDPQRGAKPIIRAHVSAAGDVEVEDEGAFFDVDTPEDYKRLVHLSTKPVSDKEHA